MSINYKDPKTGEYKKDRVLAKIPSDVQREIAQNTEDVRELKAAISHVSDSVVEISDAIDTGISSDDIAIPITWVEKQGFYHATFSSPIRTDSNVSNNKSAIVIVAKGEVIKFKGNYTKNSTQYVPMMFADDNGVVIEEHYNDGSKTINEEIPEESFTVPSGATRLYINSALLNVTYPVTVYKSGAKMPIKDVVKDNKQAIDKLEVMVGRKDKSNIYKMDTMTDGQSIILDEYIGIRKGDRVCFSSDVTSLGSITVGYTRGTATQGVKYISVDATNIYFYGNTGRLDDTIPHGLTIEHNISIVLEGNDTNGTTVTLISNGVVFQKEIASFLRYPMASVYALNTGSVLNRATLSWVCKDIDKKIWIFGDSYCDYLYTRWAYYLHQYGYDNNVLIASVSGTKAKDGLATFKKLINYGTPKYALFALGMNDVNDVDENTPNNDWLNSVEEFLSICDTNGITPILATTPNVPERTHTGKNKYVRDSGHRYVDFAKTVGGDYVASPWYSGMLSSDKVHPSAQGARALYGAVVTDFPELMID